MIKTEAVKTLKYKDLATEIPCIWNVKTEVMSVTMWADETACKSSRKYLSNTAGKHDIKGLHKRAILGTAQCSMKVGKVYHWKQHYMHHSCKHSTAQTFCTVGKWV